MGPLVLLILPTTWAASTIVSIINIFSGIENFQKDYFFISVKKLQNSVIFLSLNSEIFLVPD